MYHADVRLGAHVKHKVIANFTGTGTGTAQPMPVRAPARAGALTGIGAPRVGPGTLGSAQDKKGLACSAGPKQQK